MRDMPPVHPGEILREEFLKPLNLSVYALAKAIGVPAPRIHDIVHERRGNPAFFPVHGSPRRHCVASRDDRQWSAYRAAKIRPMTGAPPSVRNAASSIATGASPAAASAWVR